MAHDKLLHVGACYDSLMHEVDFMYYFIHVGARYEYCVLDLRISFKVDVGSSSEGSRWVGRVLDYSLVRAREAFGRLKVDSGLKLGVVLLFLTFNKLLLTAVFGNNQ